MKLRHKKVLISGASRGLGWAISQAFVNEGASVAMCARGSDLLMKRRAELQKVAVGSAKIIAQTADISSKKQVKHFIQNALQHLGEINVLVANAGIYGPIGAFDSVDWKKWCQAIDINLKGVALQCKEVIPLLKKQGGGKIIIISGGGATQPLPNFTAYAAAKAGVVRFAETLAAELKPYHIDVMAIAPGALNTDLLEEVLQAGPEKVGEAFYKKSLEQKKTGGASLEVAAQLCVYLASEISNGMTGKLISAVWDPWKTLHKNFTTIAEKDIYTLRRIVPNEIF